jgi:hypothetical protein
MRRSLRHHARPRFAMLGGAALPDVSVTLGQLVTSLSGSLSVVQRSLLAIGARLLPVGKLAKPGL